MRTKSPPYEYGAPTYAGRAPNFLRTMLQRTIWEITPIHLHRCVGGEGLIRSRGDAGYEINPKSFKNFLDIFEITLDLWEDDEAKSATTPRARALKGAIEKQGKRFLSYYGEVLQSFYRLERVKLDDGIVLIPFFNDYFLGKKHGKLKSRFKRLVYRYEYGAQADSAHETLPPPPSLRGRRPTLKQLREEVQIRKYRASRLSAEQIAEKMWSDAPGWKRQRSKKIRYVQRLIRGLGTTRRVKRKVPAYESILAR